MKTTRTTRGVGLSALGAVSLLSGLVFAIAVLAGAESQGKPRGSAVPFEAPPESRAADVLPAALLKGEDFEVGRDVENDGLMNRYRLKTTWGNLAVVSTPLLRKRVKETAAIRQIVQLDESDEFKESTKESWDAAVRGGKALVEDPGGSLSKAGSGVKRLFGKFKGRATADQGSETEDESWKQTVGFSQKKRELAVSLGVDVYSRNPQLQEALDDMTWNHWTGKMAGRVVLAVVPGAAGAALTIAKANEKFQRIDPTLPPGKVREINRKKLSDLGIPSESIERFIGDGTLSPTEQSVVVVSLEQIEGAQRREAFLDYAAHAPDGDVASFVVLQAVMYAHFHRQEEPIVGFEGIGPRLIARTKGGGVVGILPTDHLYWTDTFADMLAIVDPTVKDAPRKLLWLGGFASERAREQIEVAGWELREGAIEELMPESSPPAEPASPAS